MKRLKTKSMYEKILTYAQLFLEVLESVLHKRVTGEIKCFI